MVKSSYTRATSRNRRRIQEAFAELLAERGSLSNVTVTDLAERAEITRGTFYNYYDNLYEVGAELQGELEKQIFSEYDNLATLEAIENYIDDVFLFFEKQEEIYRELIVSDASQSFLNELENQMSKRVAEVMRINGIDNNEAKLELLITINGVIAVVRKHYRGEIDLSLDEIRDHLKAKIGFMFTRYKSN